MLWPQEPEAPSHRPWDTMGSWQESAAEASAATGMAMHAITISTPLVRARNRHPTERIAGEPVACLTPIMTFPG